MDWFPGLLSRITVGWVMAESGWGKFQNLPKVVEFFQSLGIPAANIQAPFVAGVELVGGILLILGLLTRLISIPLSITMIVAILTAKREDITAFSDLFGLSEYLYIVLMVWLIFMGPGKASLDQILKNKCASKSGS
jgi:putative oxidoreductase